MVDIEAMAEKIAGALFVKMKEGFAKRDARIAEFQATVAALPVAKDGKDAEPVDYEKVRELVVGELGQEMRLAMAALPVPKDGADGKDGESIAPEFVADLVAKAVAEIQAPANGRDGKDGTSVTVADVEPLIEQEVLKAVSSIPIPKDGKSVTIDDVRPLILSEIEKAVADIPAPQNGFNGLDGEPGTKGKDGEPGQPGRDAIELEILNDIDPTRAYYRGTYAKHNNGLWRSFETTDGMKGWDCIISGIASVDVENKNEREFTIKIVNSDGTVTEKAFSIPVMIYRGVLVEGKEYQPGDTTTWGGHLWCCNQVTNDKPIEGGKAWTLAIRRGKDGKEGPPGQKGADGRNIVHNGARA